MESHPEEFLKLLEGQTVKASYQAATFSPECIAEKGQRKEKGN